MTTAAGETDAAAARNADTKRWIYGLWAVIAGLIVILVALFIVIQNFQTAADVGTVMGIIVSPVATIVAAYFGVAAGSSGKAQADAKADRAHEAALRLAAGSTPAEAREVIDNMYQPSGAGAAG